MKEPGTDGHQAASKNFNESFSNLFYYTLPSIIFSFIGGETVSPTLGVVLTRSFTILSQD